MYLTIPSVVGHVFDIAPNFNLRCFPLPIDDNPKDSIYPSEPQEIYMVAQSTKNKDAAFAFLKYLLDKPQAQAWGEATGYPMPETNGLDTKKFKPYTQDLLSSGTCITNIPQPAGAFGNWNAYFQSWIQSSNPKIATLISGSQQLYDSAKTGFTSSDLSALLSY